MATDSALSQPCRALIQLAGQAAPRLIHWLLAITPLALSLRGHCSAAECFLYCYGYGVAMIGDDLSLSFLLCLVLALVLARGLLAFTPAILQT